MAGVPPTMRAMLPTGHGGPELLEYREDCPVPESAAGDVLVEVRDFAGKLVVTTGRSR